ncbi:hypothetical protein Q3G72_032399 [Acer saccharum]|nr:hypothetical protein Q3G72_032399 [Acer saccharum]
MRISSSSCSEGTEDLLSDWKRSNADIYTDSSGACAAFLANSDDKNDRTVVFRNMSYHLPAWSVSILPDCKNVVFNTAKVTLNIFPCLLNANIQCYQLNFTIHGAS